MRFLLLLSVLFFGCSKKNHLVEVTPECFVNPEKVVSVSGFDNDVIIYGKSGPVCRINKMYPEEVKIKLGM